MNYKSQYGEDKWIASHWSKLGLPKKGIFVEFGAADGITFSNTYWLEKSMGWNGLLIEPDPRHKIKGRKAKVSRLCVGSGEEVSFGLDNNDPCLSGIKRASSNRITIQSVPLSDILYRYNISKVDLISIDTEGTELEAWKTLDLEEWRPRVVIIEFLSWGISDRTEEVVEALRMDNYNLVHQTNCNGIFLCQG